MIFKHLISLFFVCQLTQAAFDIRDYGAIADDTTVQTEMVNAEAFADAIAAANATTTEERRVVVPENYTFSCMPINIQYINNVTIQIDGTLLVSKNHRRYPLEGKDVLDFLAFQYVVGVKIEGKGSVQGQGFMWWVRELLGRNKHGRPQLLVFREAQEIEISGVSFHDGPHSHIWIKDAVGVHIHDL